MGVHRSKPPFRLAHQCPVCHKRFNNTLILQHHVRQHLMANNNNSHRAGIATKVAAEQQPKMTPSPKSPNVTMDEDQQPKFGSAGSLALNLTKTKADTTTTKSLVDFNSFPMTAAMLIESKKGHQVESLDGASVDDRSPPEQSGNSAFVTTTTVIIFCFILISKKLKVKIIFPFSKESFIL